jgi:TM2 domain-containing membrane protein YozV
LGAHVADIAEAAVAPLSASRNVVVLMHQKSSGLAAVLSFFWCGLGQIYNGEILKGLALMVAYPFCVWIGVTFSFVGTFAAAPPEAESLSVLAPGFMVIGILMLLVALPMWVFGMINAYRTADAMNHRQLHGDDSWY